MHERIIEIPTGDGRMETFVTHPEQGGPFAPVVIFMDVWGLREELYDIARKVAVVGYYVLLPHLYYRQGRIRHLLWLCREGPQCRAAGASSTPVDYYYEVHPGAEHGYALPDRDIHDKRAANRDWELIFAMFRRQLSA